MVTFATDIVGTVIPSAHLASTSYWPFGPDCVIIVTILLLYTERFLFFNLWIYVFTGHMAAQRNLAVEPLMTPLVNLLIGNFNPGFWLILGVSPWCESTTNWQDDVESTNFKVTVIFVPFMQLINTLLTSLTLTHSCKKCIHHSIVTINIKWNEDAVFMVWEGYF